MRKLTHQILKWMPVVALVALGVLALSLGDHFWVITAYFVLYVIMMPGIVVPITLLLLCVYVFALVWTREKPISM
ncbi:MAG: hypothetical protein CFE27_02695 [Alphaproteobacteria bacterium PA1]|nr:MAG: hypothetical protein CFE27_02695 [Alphaproteobacteria bacterium PA1]